jgi:photosystem II stability/assembly factor-like uncharacterized protein
MSSASKSSAPTRPSRSLPTLSRPFWFGAALLLFLIFSWIAFRQEPHPDPYWRSTPLHADWWVNPVEFNASRRLPRVWADFNDVFALKGTGHVWVVGGGGLVLHSSDYGRHWKRQYLVPEESAGDGPGDVRREASPRSAAELMPGPASFWRRLAPGQPLESALLLGLVGRPLSPPELNQKSQAVQVPSPSQVQEPELTLRDLANSDLYSVHFVDARNGWVAGDNGALFNTRDSGRTWERKDARVGRAVHRAVFADASWTWVVGDYSNPKLSSDNGHTWFDFLKPKRATGPWSDIDVRGSRLCLVGQGIYCSSNGVTFESTFLEASASRVSIANAKSWFVGKNFFNIVGGRGFVTTRNQVQIPSGDFLGVASVDDHNAWVVGKNGLLVFLEYDGAGGWQARIVYADAYAGVDLSSISFSDSQHGWITGSAGTLLASGDGGHIWRRATRERDWTGISPKLFRGIYPAPWYYISLCFVGLLFVPALKRPQPKIIYESAEDLLISDQPISAPDADKFDFSAVALGLSRFLRNEKTMPPLTIAVTGEWGTGKSSLMNLLRGDLQRYGFRPVWFNAWHHQKEEHLLASLLETVRSQAIPPWWRPEGTIFRLRLLKIRWSRFWPLVALILLIFSFSLGYFRAHPAQFDAAWKSVTNLADPLKWLETESHSMAAGQKKGERGPWIVFLLSSVGLLVSLWKGLKGFGVNPASLLAKDSARARVRDLENLTGFRHRFAAEFRDITHALNPRTLLVLIDDLDRCRPEMVLEVLEAVNFLISSGDCFVVLGMARERVVRCVGLSFKDVASELLVTEARPDETDLKPDELARKRRIEFAHQYLEKLINIEVPVPAPTNEQARRLFEANVSREERPEHPRRDRWSGAWPVVKKALPAAAVVALALLGFWLGSTRPVQQEPDIQENVAAAAATTRETGASSPSTTTGAIPSGKLPTGPAKWEAGEEASFPMLALTVLALGIVGLGIWRLSIPPGVVIRDSREFEEALATWHPLVFSSRKTPRSIKRFLNRVRYLAMLQRGQSPEPTAGQQFLAWFGRRKDPAQSGEKAPAIPERALVALAAIEYCRLDWLQQAPFFEDPEAFLAGRSVPQEVRDALGTTPLAPYREAYSRMSEGIHLS